MPKDSIISIIIPIYNAEKHLQRCVDSILIQTYDNLEIILVNDGSLDNSGAICDSYAQKDPRIKVIHQNNRGVSFARQTGVNSATGEYVIHADADDWAESNMIEELYVKAIEEDADIVFCDYYEDIKKRTKYCIQKPARDCVQILQQLLFQQLHGSCCNKLIKRACYNAPDVSFPLGVNIYEDLYLICHIISNKVKVAYLPRAFYHYVIIPKSNSLSSHISMKVINEKELFVELMSRKKFTNGPEELFFFKKSILSDLFELHQISRLYNTYPEIHARIIQEAPKANLFNPKGYVLFMALKGHLIWAQSFRLLSLFFIMAKDKIKQSCVFFGFR